LTDCDERLKPKDDESTYLVYLHWVDRGTGIPKDRDEVNRREVCECDGCVFELDMMSDPSKLNVIRKVTDLARIFPTLDLSIEEKAARR
jgi:hypothetical protein